MPRKKKTVVARPRRAPEPLTEAQNNRYSLLRGKGLDQTDIVDHLAAKGVKISRVSVGFVLRNKFVNENVIAAFCELTGTTREQAWPDVPTSPGSGEPTRTGTEG